MSMMNRKTMTLIGRKVFIRYVLPGSLLVTLMFATGCAGGANVKVNVNIPDPLVQSVPIRMGIYYNENLLNYLHEEDLDYYGEYSIDLGSTQIPVFDRVFDAMFDTVVPMDSLSSEDLNVDAVLAPSIEQLQFSIPEQTRSDFFEVWIKYRMDFYETDGSLIHTWNVMAYGKANQKNYGAMQRKKRPALTEASTWALRDAAANVSFEFHRQQKIKEWLEKY